MHPQPPVDRIPFHAIVAVAALLLQMSASWLAARYPHRPRLRRFAGARAWASAGGIAIGLLLIALAKEINAFGLTERSTHLGIAALSGLACSVLDRTRGRAGR
jgi:ABC-type transport system involved in cytochrome c biogenesis permease subunit